MYFWEINMLACLLIGQSALTLVGGESVGHLSDPSWNTNPASVHVRESVGVAKPRGEV